MNQVEWQFIVQNSECLVAVRRPFLIMACGKLVAAAAQSSHNSYECS
jgi:hypothetical protein